MGGAREVQDPIEAVLGLEKGLALDPQMETQLESPSKKSASIEMGEGMSVLYI